MKKNIIYIIGIALAMTGCNFLDKEPDLRTDIDTQKKVRLLLTSGYDMPNYGTLGEVCSDNTVDNNTPDAAGHVNIITPMYQYYNEYFAWEDVKSYTAQDTPYWIWQFCYHNIAVANQALDAIARLEEKGQNLQAERAEALLIRAYNHFVMVNIFCHAYKDSVQSLNDLGIHYMTAAETSVRPEYSRGSVAEVYSHIEQDLTEAMKYVSDDYYTVPKYHFNVKAACAFAARFYLFKRDYKKVVEYANRVLGIGYDDALAMMWDAKTAHKQGNGEQEALVWINPNDNGNLMLCTTLSFQKYAWVPSYGRYTLNRAPRDYTINTEETGGGPSWGGNFPLNMWRFDANYGGFLQKINLFWEFDNKITGTGVAHVIRREFTSGETLLCRAEANLMLGNKADALEDLQVWSDGYACDKGLSESKIKSHYSASEGSERQKQICPVLNCNLINAEWGAQYAAVDKEIMWCILHFRRIENLHDGTRWFDIKRFGIEIDHEIGYPVKTKHLVWNDDRRAVQLPQEAILAGQQPNPRNIIGDNISASNVGSREPSVMDLYQERNSIQMTKVEPKKVID